MSGLMSAEILDALGKPEAAANLRWFERDPLLSAEEEIESLREQLAGAEHELDHAKGDADAAWNAMCARCRKKREPST